ETNASQRLGITAVCKSMDNEKLKEWFARLHGYPIFLRKKRG
ncbi:hypothetical protein LCGC14_3136290, partial [marine sediment metagenome]